MTRPGARALLAVLALAAVPFVGCDDATGTACTPGESIACTGPGACAGFQVCAGDGAGFEACVCDGATTTTSSSSSSVTSGGSTSATGGGTGGVGGMGTTSSADASSSSVSSSTGGPVCMNVFMGSFTIQNTLDIATITPYCEITGDLTASGAGLTDITLPNLQKIGGKFSATSTVDLQTLGLPALESVGTTITAGGPQTVLKTVDLGSLQSATLVELSRSVTTVDLHSLTSGDVQLSLGGGGILSGNPTLDLPLLTVGSILVTTTGTVSAPNLQHTNVAPDARPIWIKAASVNLASLESAGTLILNVTSAVSLPNLQTIPVAVLANQHKLSITATGALTLPLLTEVQGDFVAAGVTSVSLPLLKAIDGGATFTTSGAVSVPKLTNIGKHMYATPAGSDLELSGGMTSFQAPLLTEIGAVVSGSLLIEGVAFATLDLPALKAIHDNLMLGVSCASGAGANPNLVQIGLPALMSFDTLGFFQVANTPLLPQCRIDAIATKLHQSGWSPGNNPALCTTQPTSPCP